MKSNDVFFIVAFIAGPSEITNRYASVLLICLLNICELKLHEAYLVLITVGHRGYLMH